MREGRKPVGYQIDFAAVPPLGTIVKLPSVRIRLIGVEPYVRRDGRRSHVLTWQAEDGRVGTSGLRGKCVTWRKIDFEEGLAA